jgi:hypothetical protein
VSFHDGRHQLFCGVTLGYCEKIEGTVTFLRLHQPGSRLVFLDSFQQTAQFVDYVDDQGAGATMYADWLMFLGAEIEIRHLPADVWQAIEQKIAQWQSRIAIERAQRSATD